VDRADPGEGVTSGFGGREGDRSAGVGDVGEEVSERHCEWAVKKDGYARSQWESGDRPGIRPPSAFLTSEPEPIHPCYIPQLLGDAISLCFRQPSRLMYHDCNILKPRSPVTRPGAVKLYRTLPKLEGQVATAARLGLLRHQSKLGSTSAAALAIHVTKSAGQT
jgi:hypothetical protein